VIPLYIDDKTNVAMCPLGVAPPPARPALAASGLGRHIKALTCSLLCIRNMEGCGWRGLQINDAWI
jgi:hypothetical protein